MGMILDNFSMMQHYAFPFPKHAVLTMEVSMSLSSC